MYEKSIELINDFFLIQPDEQNCSGQIFEVLKKIVDFDYAHLSCPDIEYSYGTTGTTGAELQEELKIRDTAFGTITIMRRKKFNVDEVKIFKTCAGIISGIIKDIEVNKIINMQVNALQKGMQKVMEAERVKSDFFSNVSHELRTPLNAIIGFSELLGGDFAGQTTAKQKEYINDIRVSGLNLLGMINCILDMSKLEANAMRLNPSNFSIAQAVNDVVDIISPLAQKKNISLRARVEDCKISADYQKLRQILFNLLSNAVKFTPDGGRVNINARKDSGKIVISVADTGVGIEKKHHRKIFKKFEQIGSSAHSTGLGLTITKELVKLHDGSIKLDSEPGKGSVFTVML